MPIPAIPINLLKHLYQGTRTVAQVAAELGVSPGNIVTSLRTMALAGGTEGSWAASIVGGEGILAAAGGTAGAAGGAAAGGAAAGGIMGLSTLAMVGIVAGVGVAAIAGVGIYYAATSDRPVEVGPAKAQAIQELQKDLAKANKTYDDDEREKLLADIDKKRRNVEAPLLPAQVEREKYGVFLAGNDLFVGQKSVLAKQPHHSVIGWGLGTSLVGEAALRRILGPYDTPDEAKNAYLNNLKSDRRVPLSRGRMGRFNFDGGAKEYSISNAFRFLK